MQNGSLRALAAVGLVAATGTLARPSQAPAAERRVAVVEQIDLYRAETWRWETLMGRRRTRSASNNRSIFDPARPWWVLSFWKRRALQARIDARHVPHRRAWLCIHRYEGSWTANTGNGYYGGLQMSLSFQGHYARELLAEKGTANNWTPLEQMWVAERAHRSGRGFYPWPWTARACGLL